MRSQGLARRWATNILSVTAAILVVVESVFIFVVHEYYFSTVRQYLNNKMSAISTSFSSYASGSYTDFENGARQYVESFGERDKMEVQVLNSSGNVVMSTNGFMPEKSEDYKEAAAQSDGVSLWRGAFPAAKRSWRPPRL